MSAEVVNGCRIRLWGRAMPATSAVQSVQSLQCWSWGRGVAVSQMERLSSAVLVLGDSILDTFMFTAVQSAHLSMHKHGYIQEALHALPVLLDELQARCNQTLCVFLIGCCLGCAVPLVQIAPKASSPFVSLLNNDHSTNCHRLVSVVAQKQHSVAMVPTI